MNNSNILLNLFAHSGEVHENSVETAIHKLGPWYVALPLFIVFLLATGYIIWLLSGKKLFAAISVMTAILLVSGFIFANSYPVISIMSITVGIISAGFIAFTGISE